MRLPERLRLGRLQPKLLLSYLLVIAITLGVVVVFVELFGPAIFYRDFSRRLDVDMRPELADGLRDDAVRAFNAALWRALALATIVATLAALAASAVMAGRVTRPVATLVMLTRRMAGGDYHLRASVTQRDELGDLADSFNAMAAALEDVEWRRTRVMADVAHELRTPLATVQGYLEGLADGVVEPAPQLWSQLATETQRMQRLIDDLQDLSRVEAGQFALRPAPVAPARLVEAAAARVASLCAEKGLELGVAVTDAPDVVADFDRALQALGNVLVNAVRYTPAGGLVTIATVQRADEVVFVVHDTGIGIAAEHLPHVFERFYRADQGRSRAAGGSGIGLTIARALVEAQGGRVWVESDGVGRGATFSVALPRAHH